MAKSRYYSPTTLKIIFGQCGNQCAKPDCTNPIIAAGTPYSDEAVVGQICHIYAFSKNGPRGREGLTEKESNAPQNLILMCGAHHPLVDKQYETYPAVLLLEWKRKHEAKFAPETSEAMQREADLQKHAFLERLSDQEIEDAVIRLRRARFLVGFDAKQEALILASKVDASEFSGGSREVRARALAWCARLLVVGDTVDKGRELIAKSKALMIVPEVWFADVFLTAATDKSAALISLTGQNGAAARSAALRIIINADGPAAAVKWVDDAGLDEGRFDVDGKFGYMLSALMTNNWDLLFRIAKCISAEDLEENYALINVLAMAKFLSTVPTDLRHTALAQVPFDAAAFPLASEPHDIAARLEARELYQQFAICGAALELPLVAAGASDYALWLELRDPRDHLRGLEHLREFMRDPDQSLRRLPLAIQFGLKLDIPEIEKRLEQSIALSGVGTVDEAYARYALVFKQGGPNAGAVYIAKHRDLLYRHLNKLGVMATEIELLARSGSIGVARERLDEAKQEGLTQSDLEMLRRIISECSGSDPIVARREAYESTGELRALVGLADGLEEKQLWEELAPYAEKLFAQTHTLEDCYRVAHCLNELQRYHDLYEFLASHAGVVAQSTALKSVWALSLYREGLFEEAKSVLETIQGLPATRNHRVLSVNIALSSGNWAALLPYCEKIWTKRASATAEELLQAAELSYALNGPRSREFVELAVEKKPNNPAVLVGAYARAVRGSWEQTPQVGTWLRTAVDLSGSDGPIRMIPFKEIVEQKPAWDEKAGNAIDQLNRGAIPSFLAAAVLNRPSLSLTLLPSLANRHERDVRKRATVYAFHGNRQKITIPKNASIAVDPSALVTLAMLGLLEKTIQTFQITIAHSTLGWLFREREKIIFHQPSRIKDARLLKQLLANGTLTVLPAPPNPDMALIRDVGSELANMLVTAKAATERTVVVRAPPIHRLDSLMDELADVSNYRDVLCSSVALLKVLKSVGVLTASEEEPARAYLQLHERTWETEPDVDANTQFILDGIALAYLRATGLLTKLRSANLRVFIGGDEDSEANKFIDMDGLADEQLAVVDHLRATLADGLQSGRVKVAGMTNAESEQSHPSMSIGHQPNDVTLILVDDRHVTQFLNLQSGDVLTPIATTIDLLDHFLQQASLSQPEVYAHRISLRQAGYQLIPTAAAELQYHLAFAQVMDGVLVETAELKAIRQSMLQARLRRILQMPQELPFLQATQMSLLHSIRWSWETAASDEEAIARSEWIFKLVDLRGWAASAPKGSERSFAVQGHAYLAMNLVSALTTAQDDLRRRFFDWIDHRFLNEFRESQPEGFQLMVARAKELILASVVNRGSGVPD